MRWWYGIVTGVCPKSGNLQFLLLNFQSVGCFEHTQRLQTMLGGVCIPCLFVIFEDLHGCHSEFHALLLNRDHANEYRGRVCGCHDRGNDHDDGRPEMNSPKRKVTVVCLIPEIAERPILPPDKRLAKTRHAPSPQPHSLQIPGQKSPDCRFATRVYQLLRPMAWPP
jgi:hypothetical protein